MTVIREQEHTCNLNARRPKLDKLVNDTGSGEGERVSAGYCWASCSQIVQVPREFCGAAGQGLGEMEGETWLISSRLFEQQLWSSVSSLLVFSASLRSQFMNRSVTYIGSSTTVR